MKADLTDITLIVDRSGAIHEICEVADGGINASIRKQAGLPSDALVTLVQFDTHYEFVHAGMLIDDVPPYKPAPRGATALLDALGRAIGETAARVEQLSPQQRPGLVIVVVMTDGLDDSSCEFAGDQIRDLIETRQREDGWQFLFLGANQDAFAEAGRLGFAPGGVANFTPGNVLQAYRSCSAAAAPMRAQRGAGQQVGNEFTDEQRRQMGSCHGNTAESSTREETGEIGL